MAVELKIYFAQKLIILVKATFFKRLDNVYKRIFYKWIIY